MPTQLEPALMQPRIADEFDVQIRREWLLTNGRGGFASGTAVGVPTRRYHGLLIAAARPPLERWLLLAAMLERVTVDGRAYEPATFEFDQAFHPRGFTWQTEFDVRNHRPEPWVQFVYEMDGIRLTKRLIMPRGQDEVRVCYRLEGPAGTPLALELSPFVAMRDFHVLTRAFPEGFPVEKTDNAVAIDALHDGPRLWLRPEQKKGGSPVTFEAQPDWWYGFHYREEAARGQDCREDLFNPGFFRATGTSLIEVDIRASAEFPESVGQVNPDVASGPSTIGRPESTGRSDDLPYRLDFPPSLSEPTIEERLLEAADAFVVARQRPDRSHATTILAGYHWFGDWGRDAFIAMPGLLLETGRYAEARSVLETFASAQKDGLIPNRFSDYGDECDFNSVDASLWFIHAAVLYARMSGDSAAWRSWLGPACEHVIEAYIAGTDFKIGMDVDALISCGDASMQLTWMDAKCGDVVFTPRHGKPVEVNALWYQDLCLLAERLRDDDPQRASRYEELASRVAQSFTHAFWNDADRCLYDVVRDRWRDRSVRPNQIFAVSLPNSPLDEVQRRAVLSCVECELLTPYGLRSLSWRDPAYRRRYEGNPYQRDGAYHQGTVWAWLVGPYVEAYLRLHEFTSTAKANMRRRLMPLIEHLDEAGIGSVSEIFDGDPPHAPRGCIAQAWSVAVLLRAWRMTEPGA